MLAFSKCYEEHHTGLQMNHRLPRDDTWRWCTSHWKGTRFGHEGRLSLTQRWERDSTTFPQSKYQWKLATVYQAFTARPDGVRQTFCVLAPLTLSFPTGRVWELREVKSLRSKSWAQWVQSKDSSPHLTPKIGLLTTLQRTLCFCPSTWRGQARESRNNTFYYNLPKTSLKLPIST